MVEYITEPVDGTVISYEWVDDGALVVTVEAEDGELYEEEEFVNYATAIAPVAPDSIAREDIKHSTERRDVEPGDLCHVEHPELEEKVYAHFVEVAESDWTNITDGLQQEFAEFVGEDWLEQQDATGLLRPDMVINE